VQVLGLKNHDVDMAAQAYPQLVSKESPTEQVIMWDLTRTFPGHEFFAETGGTGQARLCVHSKPPILSHTNAALSVPDSSLHAIFET
jgi:hypothetical protein